MLRILLPALVALFVTACSAKAGPVERIYLSPSAGPQVVTAAEELDYHLGKIGAAPQLVRTDDPSAVDGPAVVLGELALRMGAVPQNASESKEGFRLLSQGQVLLISGESDAGTLFGAYELLERLGFDWVMPGEIGEITPAGPLTLPRLDESQAPDFSVRDLWYRGGPRAVTGEDRQRLDVWLRRQKSGDYKPAAGAVGGHVWQRFIKLHQAEFDKDRTMYALRRNPDGSVTRRGPQLESVHPRVAELMAEDIRKTYEKNGWSKDRPAGFPIGPADGDGYSISPEALAANSGAVDPITGELDQTDLIVRLGNAVLEQLGEEYPNVYLGFYSYGDHAGYPQRYRPHPRLSVIFAPINFSRYHSLVDPLSRGHPHYRAVVEKWAALRREQGNALFFYGYNWNLAENMLPYTKVRIWGEELPYYHQLGVSGVIIEATKAWGVNGPSDWLLMKLAWDASQDWRGLLDEYCRKSFGAGAEPMKRYLLRLAERQRQAGQEAGSYHAIPLIYDQAFVGAARADLAEAKRLARTPEQKTRIGYFEPSVELLGQYLDYHQAANRFDFPAALAAYEAMHATWKAAYAQNPDIAAREAPQYLERFIGPFVKAAAEQAPYIVERLPDELDTAFGEEPQNWRPTRTYSTTWDAQRLKGNTVWYRYRFTTSQRPLYLFLGSFNDEATVFVNGRNLGSSGRLFSQPEIVDMTPALKEGENELLVRIVRNQSLNELGVGGLFRPSFLFSR
ncbi:MAG TPA: DUF4838 domain-containing protein [Caulobacteraceae bacterium]|nr:DUF4838 domain-containing protein [Caulobacteraceae bacterium]